MLHVRDVMQAPVWTISPTTPITEIRRQFDLRSIGHLPVIAGGMVVGMVTSSDLRTSAIAVAPSGAPGRRADGATTKTIMSTPAINISSAAPVSDAVRLMLQHKIRAIPVVRGARLVGIITASDILRALVDGHFVRNDASALEQLPRPQPAQVTS